MDGLRQVSGLEGLADRLAGATSHENAGAASTARTRLTTGLGGDYMTITPYIAGGGTARALATNPRQPVATVSYQPKRYPFTVKADKDGASAVIPVYTIPDAATLVNNAMMTPLVGRVPFMGRLTDPFRFKLITGAANLAANGLHIPGIANAVWTGYAVGVREQSCVRAYVDTVTFVFTDGRIHTVHRGKGNTGSGGAVSVNDNLGYLTDPWGKPCLRGQFFDNAGSYLKDRGIAAFLDGLANAYANSQVTVDRSAYGLNSYVSGNTYEYALGKGISGATGEIANYVRERASDAFDVVYVPPGQNVQIFVEAEIPINYDTAGRKLQYAYGEGGSYAPLD
ncbi:MAG: TIGR03752 family integrating conjugative element protein [Candidatus Competibacteraceae bacterium]|nr:TIGR03752 family integrating conjugative element protein [Candidatus Competibacteraceae bacterium]